MSDTISTPATKYRVAIRDIAVANGWTFNQLSTSIDQFTKGDDVVAVQHGPSNLISTAERRIGGRLLRTGVERAVSAVVESAAPPPVDAANARVARNPASAPSARQSPVSSIRMFVSSFFHAERASATPRAASSAGGASAGRTP